MDIDHGDVETQEQVFVFNGDAGASIVENRQILTKINENQRNGTLTHILTTFILNYLSIRYLISNFANES